MCRCHRNRHGRSCKHAYIYYYIYPGLSIGKSINIRKMTEYSNFESLTRFIPGFLYIIIPGITKSNSDGSVPS